MYFFSPKYPGFYAHFRFKPGRWVNFRLFCIKSAVDNVNSSKVKEYIAHKVTSPSQCPVLNISCVEADIKDEMRPALLLPKAGVPKIRPGSQIRPSNQFLGGWHTSTEIIPFTENVIIPHN